MIFSIRLKTLLCFPVRLSVLLPEIMECMLSILRKKAQVISNVIVGIGLLNGEVVDGPYLAEFCSRNASGRMLDAHFI